MNFGKIRNYDEERLFFLRKKRVHLFKSLVYKDGKAQSMPMIAGHLDIILLIEVFSKEIKLVVSRKNLITMSAKNQNQVQRLGLLDFRGKITISIED